MGVIPNGPNPDPSQWARLEADANNRMAEQFQRIEAQRQRDRENNTNQLQRDGMQIAARSALQLQQQQHNMDYLREQGNQRNGEQSRRETGAISNEDMVRTVYESFRNQGLSHNGALAMVGEVGRENSFQPSLIFGTHSDPHNNATNAGLFSWQGSRRPAMMAALQEAGLVQNGRIVPGQASVNAMARFAIDEMRQRGEGDIVNRLMAPDVDMQQAARDLGTRFIRWRYNDPVYASHHNRRDAYIANARALLERDAAARSGQPAQAAGGQLALPQETTIEQFRNDRTAPVRGAYFAPSSAPDGWAPQSAPEGNQPSTMPGPQNSTRVLHLPEAISNEIRANSRPRDEFGRIASRTNTLAPLPPSRPDDLSLPQATAQAQLTLPSQDAQVITGQTQVTGPAVPVAAPQQLPTVAQRPGRLVTTPDGRTVRIREGQ